MWAPDAVSAQLLTALPEALHYTGEPTAWTQITRPGMRLHSFLEGLVVSKDGDLYVTDVPHGRIFRVDGKTIKWSVAFEYDGEPHGMAIRSDGMVVLADYRRGLLLLDLQQRRLTSLCSSYNTENFRGLSDLVIDTDGQVWFTDSGRSSLSDPTGRLFCLSPDGALRCVLDNIPYPNGVAISADGAHVFTAVTRGNAVWKISRKLPATGQPMAGIYAHLSGGLGPDGLAVSKNGVLAIAHAQAGAVWLLDPLGLPLTRITTPSGLWTTSVRFSHDSNALYIVDAQSGSILKYDLSTLRNPS